MLHRNALHRLGRASLVGSVALLASACDEPEPRTITLEFRGLVDGAPFSCRERYEGIGTSRAAFEPLDFRLYLHDFELLGTDGERVAVMPEDDQRWQRDGLVLVDFEDGTGTCATGSPSTHTQLTLRDHSGLEVDGVAFRLGVPADTNHLDAATAPAPLNEPGMWWSWRGGFKYVRADVRTDAGTPFYFHLGGTACSGDPTSGFSCGYGNIPQVELRGFDPRTDAITVDLARLYDGVDIAAPVDQAVDSVPGCMAFPGDPECPAMFDALGLAFESTAPSEVEQTVFGVEVRP